MPAKHLYALDGLRGIAALIVVVSHWVHFQYGSDGPVRAGPGLVPLWDLLWPLYRWGHYSTSLFFSLSGFIFFWLYADRVADRRVTAAEFFWLRFSRLYPLHFVTLLAVAAGQWAWRAGTGADFVYPHNGWGRFGLHLALASNWSGRSEWSFNAPVWSVSVEVLLYAAFFCLFFLRLRAWWWAAGCCAAAAAVPESRGLLADGLAAFFAGGLAYRVYAAVTPGRRPWVVTAVACALWLAVPWAVHTGSLPRLYSGLPFRIGVPNYDAGMFAAHAVTRFAPHVLLFPATVLTVAAWDARLGGPRRWLARLGQISYSAYLLHFPLQMAFAGATDAAGLSRDIYTSPASFLVFLPALVCLSLTSFHCLEMPVQNWLRTAALRATRGRAAAP